MPARISALNQLLLRYRFRLLFFSNVLLCLSLGLGQLPRTLLWGLMLLFLLAGINTLRHKQAVRWLAVLIGLINLLLFGLPVMDFVPELLREGIGLVALYLLITWVLFRHVSRERPVTGELLYGLCALYLQIALIFAFTYGAVAFVWPHSFTDSLNQPTTELHGFVYYSLATLTTVGYGDIHAMTPLARMLSASEAFIGVMFIALAVARSQALLSDNPEDP
jgi:hypothetical protein